MALGKMHLMWPKLLFR